MVTSEVGDEQRPAAQVDAAVGVGGDDAPHRHHGEHRPAEPGPGVGVIVVDHQDGGVAERDEAVDGHRPPEHDLQTHQTHERNLLPSQCGRGVSYAPNQSIGWEWR